MLDKTVNKIWKKIMIGGSLILLTAQAIGAYDNKTIYHEYNSSARSVEPIENSIHQQEEQKTAEYLAAMDPKKTIDDKIRLLETYVNKWNGSQYHHYAYAELAYSYQSKQNFDKIIVHGDKALVYKELNDKDRTRVLLCVANAYASSQKNQNLDKAKNYIDRSYQIADAHKNEQEWGALYNLTKNAKTAINNFINQQNKVKTPPPPSAYTYHNEKNYTMAEQEFAKMNDNSAKFSYYYGRTLFFTKKYDMSIENLVTASVMDSEKNYPKALETAKSIFLNHIYKDSTGKNYNTLIEESSKRTNAEIAILNKKFNEKWPEGKELTEEEEAVYKAELKILKRDIEIEENDVMAYHSQLQEKANKAFNDIVNRIKQKIK